MLCGLDSGNTLVSNLDQCGYSMSGPVNTWMGDRLRVDKPYLLTYIHT